MIDDFTQIILVRHGETAWNREERFRGRADVPLNETGLAQAWATGERIATNWQVAAVYASPLSRTVKTAEAIAGFFELPVQAVSDLVDIDYGLWQGLTPAEVASQWPTMLNLWHKDPHLIHLPTGEKLSEVQKRGFSFVKTLLPLYPGKTVVLVGHTVINRAILLEVLGWGLHRFWKLGQDPCAINVFETNGRDFTLVSLNDTGHLSPKG